MNQFQQITPQLILQRKSPQRTQSSSSKSPSGTIKQQKEVHPFSYKTNVFTTQPHNIQGRFTQPPQPLNGMNFASIQSIQRDYLHKDLSGQNSSSKLSSQDLMHAPTTSSYYSQEQSHSGEVPQHHPQIHQHSLQIQLDVAMNQLGQVKNENARLEQQYTELLKEHDEILKAYNESLVRNKMVKFDQSFSSIGDNRTENMLLEENEQLRSLLIESQKTIQDLRQTMEAITTEKNSQKNQLDKISAQLTQQSCQLNELELENRQLLSLLRKSEDRERKEQYIQTDHHINQNKAGDEETVNHVRILQNSIFLKNKLIDDMVIKQGDLETSFMNTSQQKDREIKQLKLTLIEKEEELENLQIKFVEINHKLMPGLFKYE